MSKKILVELTVFEAEQLARAASGVFDQMDEKEQIETFGDRVKTNAGIRAYATLTRAIYYGRPPGKRDARPIGTK